MLITKSYKLCLFGVKFGVCFHLNLGILKLFSKAARDVLKHVNKYHIKQYVLANKCWLKQNWICFFRAGLFRAFEMLIWTVTIKVWKNNIMCPKVLWTKLFSWAASEVKREFSNILQEILLGVIIMISILKLDNSINIIRKIVVWENVLKATKTWYIFFKSGFHFH